MYMGKKCSREEMWEAILTERSELLACINAVSTAWDSKKKAVMR